MAEERIQRRLAAILVADVVGYSRLMEAEEERTLTSLNACISDLVMPSVSEHAGRVVKTMGDGILAEFASVVEAVRCAVAIQKAMATRNSGIPADSQIQFRAGVNLGDVIVQEDDLFGDGVNVAARLEGLSEAGGIVISGSVYDQVSTKLDLTYEDLGEKQVKNIGQPVRAFAIRDSNFATRDALRSSPELTIPSEPSIAVMPFDNLSSDVEQEYFSDGVTEDIITELSKISGLFVIARHSSFSYKGRPVTLKQVGQELGVRYVLEGSVRRAGSRIRITTQLVETETNRHIWAERYDRELEDIFSVQSDVARSVASSLAVSLKPGEGFLIDSSLTDNLDAYDLYLRTRQTPFPPTRENILNARSAYEHIIVIDPAFVGGHAGSALTHAMAVVFGVSTDPNSDARLAVEKAQRAIAINETFAPAHSALGMGYLAQGNHDQAIESTKRATELQPGDADAYSCLGIVQLFSGNGQEACEAAETALRLDPQFTGGPYLNLLGNAKFLAKEYGGSVDAFRRNMARGGPMGPSSLHCWAAACAADGQADEAKRVAGELLSFLPEFSVSNFGMPRLFKSADHAGRIRRFMLMAGLPD